MEDYFSSSAFLWILLTLFCLVLIFRGFNKIIKRTGWEKSKQQKIFFGITAITLSWGILLSVLSLKGFFADFSTFPPRVALAVLIPLPFALIFTFSITGNQLLKVTPTHLPILFQSFRIFVEFLLLIAFLEGRLPIQMTFDGRNFDILSGIVALPVSYFLYLKKSWSGKLAIAYNILGILLLLNILVIAVLSMPTPVRYFMNEPANTLIAVFPFIWLPGILVPIAYSMHIFSLYQLIKKQTSI